MFVLLKYSPAVGQNNKNAVLTKTTSEGATVPKVFNCIITHNMY